MHRIQIDQIEGVYDVRVGCQQTYCLTAEALLADLKAYLADPEGITKRFFAYQAARVGGDKCAEVGQPTLRENRPPEVHRNPVSGTTETVQAADAVEVPQESRDNPY
jgi:hypothetical protein